MSHAARQLPAWLIFDVRQDMMHAGAQVVRPSVGFWLQASDGPSRKELARFAGTELVVSAAVVRPIFGACFREESTLRLSQGSKYSPMVIVAARKPNQPLEPTRGAVTPRAMESRIDCPMRDDRLIAARGAPAPRVAHL